MKLRAVTLTGADDSVSPKDLATLSDEFPFVEWGILFSKDKAGVPRYPSEQWVSDLVNLSASRLPPMRLSAHLCGQWSRDLLEDGRTTWWEMMGPVIALRFDRVQINTGGKRLTFRDNVKLSSQQYHQIILQVDGLNDLDALVWVGLYSTFAALHDLSHGAGVTPGSWPAPVASRFTGYAGGLTPDNVVENIEKIASVAGDASVWIDAETGVRDDTGERFDLDKVRRFLEAAAPFVSARPQSIGR